MNEQMKRDSQSIFYNFYLITLANCSQGCQYGDCTAPNTCTCQSGWTGNSCNIGKILNVMLYRTLTTVVKLHNYNN